MAKHDFQMGENFMQLELSTRHRKGKSPSNKILLDIGGVRIVALSISSHEHSIKLSVLFSNIVGPLYF